MIRTYGDKPYRAAVIHGGPGSPGSVACIARNLSTVTGIVEPIQSRYSVSELIEELHEQLESVTDEPMTLIGHSWGAWLSVLLAAEYPDVVKHIVLVGSGPFEERYVPEISERRFARLSFGETGLFRYLLAVLDERDNTEKDDAMNRLAMLVEKSDNVDLLAMETDDADLLPVDGRMYAAVWPQAAEMRRRGRLAECLKKLTCPIHVVHGNDDPHPIRGVLEPLRENDIDCASHLLRDCGHSPFREKYAYQEFYRILGKILRDGGAM